MTSLDKVKILVVGDSGRPIACGDAAFQTEALYRADLEPIEIRVGKSSMVHLICHNEPVHNPSWTIGCAVDVKLHEYKEGTSEQRSYFVELWDIGGSSSHASSRGVFYTPVHGLFLVHDLTNKKSEQNLRKWLSEVLNKEANGKHKSNNGSFRTEFDPERFVDNSIPILIFGTKQDLVYEVRSNRSAVARRSSLAEECGAEELLLDCLQVKSLAPGSSNAVKLSRFFDKVIERRYFSRESNQTFLDRRRHLLPSVKSHHAD